MGGHKEMTVIKSGARPTGQDLSPDKRSSESFLISERSNAYKAYNKLRHFNYAKRNMVVLNIT